MVALGFWGDPFGKKCHEEYQFTTLDIDNKDRTTNYVILQDYIEGAEKGDVRILLLNRSTPLVPCAGARVPKTTVQCKCRRCVEKHVRPKRKKNSAEKLAPN